MLIRKECSNSLVVSCDRCSSVSNVVYHLCDVCNGVFCEECVKDAPCQNTDLCCDICGDTVSCNDYTLLCAFCKEGICSTCYDLEEKDEYKECNECMTKYCGLCSVNGDNAPCHPNALPLCDICYDGVSCNDFTEMCDFCKKGICGSCHDSEEIGDYKECKACIKKYCYLCSVNGDNAPCHPNASPACDVCKYGEWSGLASFCDDCDKKRCEECADLGDDNICMHCDKKSCHYCIVDWFRSSVRVEVDDDIMRHVYIQICSTCTGNKKNKMELDKTSRYVCTEFISMFMKGPLYDKNVVEIISEYNRLI